MKTLGPQPLQLNTGVTFQPLENTDKKCFFCYQCARCNFDYIPVYLHILKWGLWITGYLFPDLIVNCLEVCLSFNIIIYLMSFGTHDHNSLANKGRVYNLQGLIFKLWNFASGNSVSWIFHLYNEVDFGRYEMLYSPKSSLRIRFMTCVKTPMWGCIWSRIWKTHETRSSLRPGPATSSRRASYLVTGGERKTNQLGYNTGVRFTMSF